MNNIGFNGINYAFKNLASSIGLSTTALGGFLGVAAGITIAVALFKALDTTADESRESLSSMQSDYEDTKSKVGSLHTPGYKNIPQI